MKKVFLIHGYEGEPNGGCRPWLMRELALKDVWACALAMPDSNAPKKEAWVAEIARQIGVPDKNVFLVGHSLGVPAILRYLETLSEDTPVGGVVLMSGPIYSLHKEKYISLDHFFDPQFNFEHIKKTSLSFTVIHGDNDLTVPITHGEELAQKLASSLVLIKNGGHLSGSEGFRELPEVLIALEKMLA